MAEDVPAFDDLPSFDDLPDAPGGGTPAAPSAALKFDDLPSFDEMSAGQAEGPVMSAARSGANAILPGAAALSGFGVGAELAAPTAPFTYGIGPVVGGLVGAGIAAYGAAKIQGGIKEAVGLDDSAQVALNAEAHPVASAVGETLGGMAGMGPAGTLTQRAIGAGLQTAVEGGQQAYRGEFNPATLAVAAGGGALLPTTNRLGQVVENAGRAVARKFVPGRPGRTPTPDADTAHQAVGDTTPEDPHASAFGDAPPSVGDAQVATTGNPQSAPTRSERVYKKGSDPAEQARYKAALDDPEAMREFAADQGLTEADAREIAQANYEPAQGDMLTQGDIAPDVGAALKEAAPEPAKEPAIAPAPPAPPRAAAAINQSKGKLSLKPRAPEPVVETGFPKEGEPLAVGENEATPVPKDAGIFSAEANPQFRVARKMPDGSVAIGKKGEIHADLPDTEPYHPAGADLGFADANGKFLTREEAQARAAARKSPRNETAINASVTDAQLKAGNYPKERTHDFGKPQRVETYAGDKRRGVGAGGEPWEHASPYDYGYFNKTIGKDKDHVDFARPPQGSPDRGDKHFIVDQKNLETGKFDEHKVFTDFKDEATARKHYEAGFGDGKGAERLGAIKEVTRPELVKLLQRHTNKPWNKPYSMVEEAAPKVAAKPAAERAVIKDLIAKGKTTPEAIAALPPAQVEAAIAGKRTRNYGVNTGASAGYPVAGLTTKEGTPVTANSKLKAQERAAKHKEVQNWFEESKPPSLSKETNGELLSRITPKPGRGDTSGWSPEHKPAEWMWAREASKLLKKPTPANIKRFRDAERLLRGAPEDVENYRGGNRVDADIARSKRSGDEAVANAEAKNVDLGRNTAEDDMIAKIDAKREAPTRLYRGENVDTDRPTIKGFPGSYFFGEADKSRAGAYGKAQSTVVPHSVMSKLADLSNDAVYHRLVPNESDRSGAWSRGVMPDEKFVGALREHGFKGFKWPRPDGGTEVFLLPEHVEKLRYSEPRFDVPHEEAEMMVKPQPVKTAADLKELPHRTVNSHDEALGKIDTNAISKKVLSEADASLVGRKGTKANVESEGAASPVRKIKIDDNEKARIMAEMNKAAKRNDRAKGDTDPLPPERDPSIISNKGTRDLFDRVVNEGKGFIGDEQGSLNVGKIKADVKRLMGTLTKTSDHESYIAAESKGAVDDYARSLGDIFQSLRGEYTNHKLRLNQEGNAIPKDLATPANFKEIFKAREKDSAHIPTPNGVASHITNLSPDAERLYDDHLKARFDENDRIAALIRQEHPDMIGPDVEHHIQRLRAGDDAQFNLLMSNDDPTSPMYNALKVHAGAAQDRKFYALERTADGKRVIIAPTDKGFDYHVKGKIHAVTDPKFEFEANQPYKAGTHDTIMRHATTDEIMKHVLDSNKKPMEYYQNAGFASSITNLQLGEMLRNLNALKDVRNSPEFKSFSTTNEGKAKKETPQWEEPTLPNFKGTYVHPAIKAALDDYAGIPQNALRRFASAVTKTLFWMPTAHINNVGAHWLSARGYENFTPQGMKRLMQTAPKAFKSVINQDAFQHEMRAAGAGTIYGGVLTRKPVEQLAKVFGMDIKANPSKWGPIADKLGVPLKSIPGMIYDNASKVMWSVNDILLTQRVMELKDQGKSLQHAIVDAERDIPNYRLPIKIMGSRMLQQALSDPLKVAFGRYHYGMFNSYANQFKDLLGNKATPGDRLAAAGRLMTTGLLLTVLYPMVWDKGAQLLTGNPEAKAQRRGPAAIPDKINDALHGKTDLMAAARSSLTLPPLTTTALETLQNRDFRGKPIVEPGDLAGTATQKGRAALQFGAHIAKGLISPLSTISTNAQKDVSPAGAIRDQATDVKNPSKGAVKYEKLIGMHNQRDTVQRFKKGGVDPIEGLYNKLFGYK